jgi:putative spermidine/putrescine transport system ATP-binding protein
MSKNIDVELKNIRKSFGSNVVVENINLQIEQGECVSFLGPSGCGKTTTLNMIAGFLEPDQGDLFIKGKRMNGLPSNKRELGMVFQTYSLFPHMTIFENVAYGLKLRKTPKSEMQERVKKILEVVKLPGVADRYPKQLSGGQRQRIAIARALDELKRLQQEIGVTTIFVTHDQEEALYLSNRIVVLANGKMEQVGNPWEIYNRPASEFVHTFIGKSNRMYGILEESLPSLLRMRSEDGFALNASPKGIELRTGDQVSMYVRPERIQLAQEESASAHMNRVKGQVKLISFLGAYTECEVVAGKHTITVRLQSEQEGGALKQGETVYLEWKPEDMFVFPGKVE